MLSVLRHISCTAATPTNHAHTHTVNTHTHTHSAHSPCTLGTIWRVEVGAVGAVAVTEIRGVTRVLRVPAQTHSAGTTSDSSCVCQHA